MAGLELDKVIQDLVRRFSAPLPEFYRRRIIFWHDEEREFEDKLDEIEIQNVKLVRLTGSNTFAVKKLLALDDTMSNILVYRPFEYDSPDDNWLLNMELYSESFRSDRLAIWMDELHIEEKPVMRKAVKAYREFFNAQEYRGRVAKLSAQKVIDSPSALHLAVMGALCGSEAKPGAILKAVLSAGARQEENSLLMELETYQADTAFWAMVKQGTGYTEEKPDAKKLAAHVLLTAATRTMPRQDLAGLDSFLSIPHQAYCYDFISDWLHSAEIAVLYTIAAEVENELRLPQRFEKLPLEDIADVECFPCVNECILKRLMTDIGNQLIDVDMIRSFVEKRRTCAWYSQYRYYFDGILQVANMQSFYKEQAGGFHTASAAKLWKKYTDTYYKMDTYYRLFHKNFAESLKEPDPELDDLMKRDVDVVEGLYKNWFLSELSGNWTKVCGDELQEYGKILEVKEQTRFYRDYVQRAGSRVFVIISDALRYEVAASLSDELRLETQAQVDLQSVQGVFPTITPFGMAALLPHKELTAQLRNEQLYVLADGSPTESSYRDKMLKAANPDSIALQYEDVVRVKNSERSAWVKGKNVVYIYHDTIDATAHTNSADVFPACEDAIQEIKSLIRIIVNGFGGTNIIVTADHGFLYTYSPLTENDKVDKSSFAGKEVEYGRRYAIMKKGATPDYLMPVRFLDGNTEFDAFAPRECVRIKMSGGDLNFVHGGISLQEMTVPVISYHFLRNSTKEYQRNRSKYDTEPVKVYLLSASRKISNMIFSLNFYQKEAVGGNREAANYLLYFEDAEGKQVSDTQKIIADKIGTTTQDRTFRCTFHLKSRPYNSSKTYYLVIANESGLWLPQREEFQINIALAVDDFNFF